MCIILLMKLLRKITYSLVVRKDSATAACYAIIERLSSNLINHFGLEAIDPTIDRLNIFQTSLVSNLEKFKYR
jgi:hypothetical protein